MCIDDVAGFLYISTASSCEFEFVGVFFAGLLFKI